MKLNLYALLDELKKAGYQPKAHIVTPPALGTFSHVRAYTRECAFHDDALYQIIPEEVEELDEEHAGKLKSFISVGEPPQRFFSSKCDFIWIDPAAYEAQGGLFSLMDCIDDAVGKYNSWLNEMYRLLCRNASLDELLKTSLPVFENPISIVNPFYEVIASVYDEELPKARSEYAQPQKGDLVTAFEIFCDRNDNPEKESMLPDLLISHPDDNVGHFYAKSNRYPFVRLGPVGPWKDNELAYNLFEGDVFCGRIRIEDINRKFSKKDYLLIRELGEVVRAAMRERAYVNLNTPQYLEHTLVSLLEDRHVNRSQLFNELNSIAWDKGDLYCCMVIDFGALADTPPLVRQLAKKWCSQINDLVYFLYNGNVVCLANLRDESSSRRAVQHTLSKCIEEDGYNAFVSCSNVFYDITKLRSYYLQARGILKVGTAITPQSYCYDYADYAFDYLVYQYTRFGDEAAPPELFCPEGIIRLSRYDEEHGANLAQTLYCYIKNNLNATKTAQELYVHRNTLLGRLERINEIANLDLENPRDKMLAFLALEVMQADGTTT